MQCENDESSIKSVVINELPCEVVVADFVDEYSQYLQRHQNSDQGAFFIVPLLVIIIAGLMVLVGGVTIILGPDTVSYSRLTGPTFLQLIQLYPGPIVSVGFLLLGLGNYLARQGDAALTPEQFLLKFYELKLANKLDDSTGVSIAHMDGALFQVTRD